MNNPWFRLYSRVMTDPKIEVLSFDDQRHFVWVLCMKNEGYIDEIFPSVEAREKMVSRKLGLQGEAFEAAKKRLLDVGLIDKNWQPFRWNDLQFVSDSSKSRTRKYRINKNKPENVTVSERHSDVTVTVQNRTDTDTEQNRTENTPCTTHTASSICPHQEILSLYHEVLHELPRHLDWTGKRASALKARWLEDPNRQTIEWWRGFFEYIRRSDFLMGRVEPTPGRKLFRATLEWIVTKTMFERIREGNYHDGVTA